MIEFCGILGNVVRLLLSNFIENSIEPNLDFFFFLKKTDFIEIIEDNLFR